MGNPDLYSLQNFAENAVPGGERIDSWRQHTIEHVYMQIFC